MNKIIFPGSFDPFHEGHKFVVETILKKFDYVYIVISWNESKQRKETFESSKYKIEKIFKDNKNIEVLINENKLTTTIAKELECFNIVRGIRNWKDKIYEKKLKKIYLSSEPNLNFYYVKSNKKFKKNSSTSLKK
ncbi:MAG: adenylyltransferase/cytidyltransferase family protein [Mycoplasmataceae bacterium]|nr:adenylyltransferase/cytidyltransferase family protein [Mycoplasmataceae bacterium]